MPDGNGHSVPETEIITEELSPLFGREQGFTIKTAMFLVLFVSEYGSFFAL